MEAIQLNHALRPHRYASGGISVTPDPPQVGVATTVSLYLKNAGSKPVTVSRIETMIAQFGMGVAWEELPALGPFQLPADPNHIEKVSMLWTPRVGGHRCVRANVHVETLPTPLRIGRNLHVIESEVERARWQVPFRLGNPEEERRPIILAVDGSTEAIAHLFVKGRMVHAGEPIWLDPKEEVEAFVLLRAHPHGELKMVHAIEASIEGRFIDGIQIVVHRPAPVEHPERYSRSMVRHTEQALVPIMTR